MPVFISLTGQTTIYYYIKLYQNLTSSFLRYRKFSYAKIQKKLKVYVKIKSQRNFITSRITITHICISLRNIMYNTFTVTMCDNIG